MAAAEVATQSPTDRAPRRKPFTQWVKNLTNLKHKGGEQQERGNAKKTNNPLSVARAKRNNGTYKNNPYPESGHLQPRDHSPSSSIHGGGSFDAPTSRAHGSFGSLPRGTSEERELQGNGTRSGAPTLATTNGTTHSDAGHSKAATMTTHGGALSTRDGAGADSTFSSPNQSQHSLTTTLTTIQSTSPGNALQTASGQTTTHQSGAVNASLPVMFSHQYPVSPAPSTPGAPSAIPRHMHDSLPNTYNSATANGLLTDNASILTLASSSKRRRRSMDTDASVRALAPSSVWGGSRESLPLSVLSANIDTASTPGVIYPSSHTRPSIGALASAERASVYSSQGITSTALASERNSYYAKQPTKDLADAKSLRSLTNLDARSIAGDARSVNADAKSMGGDVGSVRNYESSVRSGAMGHSRNDSIPGSISSPLASPGLKQWSGAVSRQSIELQGHEKDEVEAEDGDGNEDETLESMPAQRHEGARDIGVEAGTVAGESSREQ